MTRLASIWILIVGGIAVLAAAPARAQNFPPDADWEPLLCDDEPMTDPFQDEAGAIDERDIVGTGSAAAGLRAIDSEFLYMRMRLDDDPAPANSLRPFTWGMEFDLDDDLGTYEVLVLVDGNAESVSLFSNDVTTARNDPNDPADQPAVATYSFASNGRTIAAAGSSFGDGADRFLDFAIPWDDLRPLGLDTDTPIYVWVASSSSPNSLNGDFACHDGATGDPRLEDIASDPTVSDPDADSDGDGFTDAEEVDAGTDPDDPDDFPRGGEGRLEGGGGCSIGSRRAQPPATWVALALVVLGWRAHQRRCPHRRG